MRAQGLTIVLSLPHKRGIPRNSEGSFVTLADGRILVGIERGDSAYHPGRVITCCAYSEYREPPTEVYLLPNVSITLCTNYLPHVWKPGAKSDYLEELGAWADKTDMIYVWDYWYARRGAGTA